MPKKKKNQRQRSTSIDTQQGPIGSPQQGPIGTPQQGPSGISQQGPSARQQQGPSGTPQQGPSVRQWQGPSVRQWQGPSVIQWQGPSGTSQQGPNATQQQGPSGTPQQGPSDRQWQGPSARQHQGASARQQQGPIGIPQQGPSARQQQGPIVIPQQGPSTRQQQGPIVIPQQGPIFIPQQGPIFIPQQGPIVIPQQGPIVIPQQGPSATQWQGPILIPQQGPIVIPQQGPSATQWQGPILIPQQGPSARQQQGPSARQQQGPSARQQQGPSARQHQGPSARQQQGPSARQQQGPSARQQQGLSARQQQGPSGTPQQGPSGTPQQGPSARQQEGPSGTPQQGPSGTPQQGPSGTPQQGPTGTPQLGPSGSPQQGPSARQQQGPSGTPQQGPSGTPQQGPSGTPQQGPSGTPQQGPSGTPQQGPSGTPQQGPSGTPQQGPSGTPQQGPSGTPQQGPSGTPQQGPSGTPQQGPSGTPQQGPNGTPQQGPSGTPQQGPSGTPQQGPSGTPQQGPSDTQQQQQQSGHVEQRQALVSSERQASDSEQLQQPTGVVTTLKVLPEYLQQIYWNQMPLKNSVGTTGKKIMVETNMFRLIFPRNFETNVIHYDVVITPDKPKCFLRTVFEEFRKKQCPKRYPAFDGRKNAYSANDLPFGDQSKEEEITLFDNEFQKERTFKIYLKKVAFLDLSWIKNLKYDAFESDTKQQCIQALDIILRHGPASQYVTVGRSLFQAPEPGKVISLTNGLNLWFGVFQSAIVGSRAYLNVDVAHKGFPKEQSVIDLMKELCQNPKAGAVMEHLTARDIKYNEDKITKFLKGLKVQYELQDQPSSKRVYVINGLVDCARENKFTLKDGTINTVEQYFFQTKKYRIKHPDLPCLWVGSKNSRIHVPAELCTIIAGQAIRRKLDNVQTSKMIRETATDTQLRKDKIMSGFAKMDLNGQPSLLNEFHFSVHGEFEKVPARVLEAPQLQYKDKQVNVLKGTWRADKFLTPCHLPENSWTILNLDNYVRDSDLHLLHDKLRHYGSSLNMTINRALTPFTKLRLENNIRNIIAYFEEKKKQEIKLVLVILPNIDGGAYSVVKQISELKIDGGVVTQCIKQQTIRRLNDSTVGNILLKINSKLNGVNHTFVRSYRPPCLEQPCMIVGADVTHPSPDALTIPSIAAVAASYDPNAFRYNVEIRLQPPKDEMIRDMEQIMIIHLKRFYSLTGYKPKKIIVYRDGVSDGQLLWVMHHELEAIKRAIKYLNRSEERDIAITFFVVQKRHHIRLFPTDRRNSDDRNFNVQAGTVVDTEITHPTYVDFYLVSHASIQGTARPTKYRCICNESHMLEDEIEQLTYYLCHMFARCTRSVSYPAPTYYAHLAAFRARALIHNVNVDVEKLEEEQRNKMTLKITKSSPMFFV